MGQVGSQPAGAGPQRPRRANTLPHEPLRHASKVLPSLNESPRLRSTDNGAILQSGGTISGRRPTSNTQETSRPHSHVHTNMYRSRSANTGAETNEFRSRERDPLHRSHTNLDYKHTDNNSYNKKFGSEPDLRVEEEQQKPKTNNKHFRKKYRAPPPPINDYHNGSSPDSSDGNTRSEPHKKLRLFKTRNETINLNGHTESKLPIYKSGHNEFRSLDYNETNFERRYKSPIKDKEQHIKYPYRRDMEQSSASLMREELLLSKQSNQNTKIDRVSGCRAKTSREQNETWKTPLINRNFRYSERFKKDCEPPLLRREKTFDNIPIVDDTEKPASPKSFHHSRMMSIGEQLKDKKISPTAKTQPIGKSLPSLLQKHSEEKDEFQLELKKATNRIRNELGNKINLSENKTSQNDKTNTQKPIPTKSAIPSKVKDSSPTNFFNQQESKIPSRKPLSRLNEIKPKSTISPLNKNIKNSETNNKEQLKNKENGRTMPDRGQASGKESTPEHSPTRTPQINLKSHVSNEKQNVAPSKQFYFGMVERKQTLPRDNLKDFPGLGSPIIEEFNNFHLIEKKLLGYHEEDDEFDKFNAKLKKENKNKNLSSESALSSDGSEIGGSDESLEITVRLRPTPPKRQMVAPRFSPAAAWRQLASLDAHLASQTQPLAVETKVAASISPESSPRSEESADKSGDSGISGDHANSDHRIDSPSRHHMTDPKAAAVTWTPQQDLGDSSSDGVGVGAAIHGAGMVTYSPGAQPFSLSLPRDGEDKGRQLQQSFNSLQKLRKSVSGALGAALGTKRFELEHEPMLEEPEQNWFLTKSAPNSLSNPLLYQRPIRGKSTKDIKVETSLPPLNKDNLPSWRPSNSYVSWGGHLMYLPPAATAPEQPLSMLGALERPVRSKSSGSLEVSARAARAAALASEMREKERSASPEVARALPARVEPAARASNYRNRGKRFTFQSTVRQLERRKIAEKLSKEADLKEQQRKTELEAMRRVEEEFQRKRAREKANIRQQLRLVSSGASSMPHSTHHKSGNEPDGSCHGSPAPDRTRDGKQRHSNTSSEISTRSKSTTPVHGVDGCGRVYLDWAGPGALPAHAHPPACARMPKSTHLVYNAAAEVEAFSGSPRSDNYRMEFARGRSPRTPRAPRLLPAARTPSTSGSELSLRQPIKISEDTDGDEPAMVPLRVVGPARPTLFTH